MLKHWHLVDMSGTDPPCHILPEQKRPPPFFSLRSRHLPSRSSPPSILLCLPADSFILHRPVFVCVFVCLLVCLHARLWFLSVCVCLHQKPQPHRNERGAMGRHTGPSSRWGHPQHQRSILPGPGAAPRQTLPGLVLEWSGDHSAGVWLSGPGLRKERLQTVRRCPYFLSCAY